jgi:deoxyadenosine/deoxycytidine kinase
MAAQVLYIEGNIGAGKSTLITRLNSLSTHYGYRVMTEPVDDWNYALSLYYSYPCCKNAYLLQTAVMASFLKRETEHLVFRRPSVIERSSISSLLFAELNCTPEDYEKLSKNYQELCPNREKNWKVLYLHTSVDKCLKNIEKRNSSIDKKITKNYLKRVEEKHLGWLSKLEIDSKEENAADSEGYYVINGDQDEDQVFHDSILVIQKWLDIRNSKKD